MKKIIIAASLVGVFAISAKAQISCVGAQDYRLCLRIQSEVYSLKSSTSDLESKTRSLDYDVMSLKSKVNNYDYVESENEDLKKRIKVLENQISLMLIVMNDKKMFDIPAPRKRTQRSKQR